MEIKLDAIKSYFGNPISLDYFIVKHNASNIYLGIDGKHYTSTYESDGYRDYYSELVETGDVNNLFSEYHDIVNNTRNTNADFIIVNNLINFNTDVYVFLIGNNEVFAFGNQDDSDYYPSSRLGCAKWSEATEVKLNSYDWPKETWQVLRFGNNYVCKHGVNEFLVPSPTVHERFYWACVNNSATMKDQFAKDL